MKLSDDPDQAMSAELWRAVSAELDRLLELPESEQQPWLESLKTRDPVRAAWVVKLLGGRHSDAFAGFLQESAGIELHEFQRSTLTGARVGAYEVDAEVGRGGMGTVWRAHRADGSFEGMVALKFLHAHFLGSDGERRFRAERRLLARLDHPHIARLIDAGTLNGREPYLVLEYVQGEPIDIYCDRHELRLRARLQLFLDVLAAVVHAHRHLIVHRDIKPSNILVTAESSVKLLDFGIAKLLEERDEGGARTQTRWAALTPLYAAPEQLLSQPITTATDVYALGLVLFRLLTGKHAILPEDCAGEHALHTPLTADPQRASAVAAIPGIPARALAGDIDNILAKALKRDPAERYSTAEAFADDLRRYLADEPVAARADALGYRVRKLLRRRRAAVLTTAAAALALLVTSGVALWQAHRAGLERDAAVKQARRADSVGEFMAMLLGDISRSGTPRAQRANLDHARELLAKQHFEDPLLEANLLTYLSSRYQEFGYPQTAIQLLRQAEVALSSGDDQIARAQVNCELANLLDDLGDEASAQREVDAAMQTMDRLGSSVRPEVRSDCRVVQSYVATALGRNRAAIAAAQKAVDELQTAGLRTGIGHITALNALARAHARAGDNASAVALLMQIRAGASESGPPQTIDAWIHQFNEATDLFAGGRVLEAAGLATVLMAATHGSEGSTHDVTALKAQALMALNQGAAAAGLLRPIARGADTAGQQLERALLEIEAFTLAGDGNAALPLWSQWQLAAAQAVARGGTDAVAVLRVQALLHLGSDPDGAGRLLERAAVLAVDADGASTPALRGINMLRAELALRQGAPQTACALAEAVVSQAQREAVDRNSSAWIGEGLLLRARCAQALGDQSTMRALAEKAVQHLQDNLGPNHPDTLLARSLAGS
jgi:serine/threonine-protein kinase